MLFCRLLMSNRLDSDQARHFVRPYLGPKCLQRLSADNTRRQRDNLCKQFGPRLGPTQHQALSGSKLFNTLIVFQEEFFEKVDFEKSEDDKKS